MVIWYNDGWICNDLWLEETWLAEYQSSQLELLDSLAEQVPKDGEEDILEWKVDSKKCLL